MSLVVAALVAALAVGCGDDEGMPAAGTAGSPGEGGNLLWALDGPVAEVDPLLAETRPERLVARQIFEPLVERLGGPFADSERVAGLAVRARETRDPTVWRIDLRQGVSFQDGTRLNGAAVLANFARWQASGVAGDLLPEVVAADAPRPHMVRFILDAPDPELGDRLSSPRLGLVSPPALGEDPAAFGERPIDAEDAGTGAFELRERDRGRLLLARNTDWWGGAFDLGPALDQIELHVVRRSRERLRLLREGSIQVADGIGEAGEHRLRSDPLLSSLPQGQGRWRGIERSVRGIRSGRGTPPLRRVWLTRVSRLP